MTSTLTMTDEYFLLKNKREKTTMERRINMNTEPRMNISDKIKEICPVEIYVDYRDFDFLEELVVDCKTQQEFEEKLEKSYLNSFYYEIDEIESYLLSEGYSVEEIEEHRDEIVVYLDTN